MKIRIAEDEDDVRKTVRAELLARRVKQRDLAEHLGISEKHLSQMLLGRAGLSLPMLFRMCAHLNLCIMIAPREAS